MRDQAPEEPADRIDIFVFLLSWAESLARGDSRLKKMNLDNVGETVLRFRRELAAGLVGATLFMAYAAAGVNISTRFIDFFPADHNNVALT